MKNSRTIKNVIMIAIIIFMVIALLFTIKSNKEVRHDMNNRQGPNKSQNIPFDNNSSNQEKTKPEDNNTNESKSEDNESNSETKPKEPQEDSNERNNNNLDRGNRPNRDNRNRNYELSNREVKHSKSNIILIVGESIIISSLTMYLIMSKFNKKSFKETLEDNDKVAILILGTILLTAVITIGFNGFTKSHMNNDLNEPQMQDNRPSIDNWNNSNNQSNIEETTEDNNTENTL